MAENKGKIMTEEQLAELYSKLDLQDEEVIQYYVNLLQKYKGPMLEINCGTGNILVKLQEMGIRCDGLDASVSQLKMCSEKLISLGLEAQLFNTDFSDFNLPNKYNAIFIPKGTFCIIADYDKAFHCLQMLSSSLENGGTLILDIFVPWKSLLSNLDNCWKIGKTFYDIETGEDFVYSYFDSFDLSKQIRTTHSKYELYLNGELQSVRLDVVRYHWYGDNEFNSCSKKPVSIQWNISRFSENPTVIILLCLLLQN